MRYITLVFLLFTVTGSFAQELHIYNGSEYTAFYRNMQGHPYLVSDSLLKSDVYFDGTLYRNIPLAYNIADNQVYIRYSEQGFNIRLPNEKVSYFIINGRKFVNGSGIENASESVKIKIPHRRTAGNKIITAVKGSLYSGFPMWIKNIG